MIREVWSGWCSKGPHGDSALCNTGGWEDDEWRERHSHQDEVRTHWCHGVACPSMTAATVSCLELMTKSSFKIWVKCFLFFSLNRWKKDNLGEQFFLLFILHFLPKQYFFANVFITLKNKSSWKDFLRLDNIFEHSSAGTWNSSMKTSRE